MRLQKNMLPVIFSCWSNGYPVATSHLSLTKEWC